MDKNYTKIFIKKQPEIALIDKNSEKVYEMIRKNKHNQLFKKIKVLIAYSLPGLLLACSANSSSCPSPTECSLQLTAEQGSQGLHLYLIRNQQTQAILLNHQATEPAASAGWGSVLDGQQCSVLLINKPSFSLTCQDPKSFAYLPCDGKITASTMTTDVVLTPSMGNYWVIENSDCATIAREVEQRLQQSSP